MSGVHGLSTCPLFGCGLDGSGARCVRCPVRFCVVRRSRVRRARATVHIVVLWFCVTVTDFLFPPGRNVRARCYRTFFGVKKGVRVFRHHRVILCGHRDVFGRDVTRGRAWRTKKSRRRFLKNPRTGQLAPPKYVTYTFYSRANTRCARGRSQ
jgi:hypothetical protein